MPSWRRTSRACRVLMLDMRMNQSHILLKRRYIRVVEDYLKELEIILDTVLISFDTSTSVYVWLRLVESLVRAIRIRLNRWTSYRWRASRTVLNLNNAQYVVKIVYGREVQRTRSLVYWYWCHSVSLSFWYLTFSHLWSV